MAHASLEQRFVYGENDNEDILRGLGRIHGRLLDLGSGAGSWGGRLRAAGAVHLVALDPSPAAVEIAAGRYDRAVIGTIEETELGRLGGEPFDVIVAADVLEHLVDPWQALIKLRSWAAADATLAVSVPNLRFYRLLGNLLLRGQFEYERWGVRDWTHLRWFTRASLAHTLRSTGWEPARFVGTATPKGRALAALSDTVANDLLRQQLTVIARARPMAAPPSASVAR